MRCRVIEYLVIVERVIDRNVALSGKSNSHEDRPGHGDGVERVEDIGEQEDLGICIKTKPF